METKKVNGKKNTYLFHWENLFKNCLDSKSALILKHFYDILLSNKLNNIFVTFGPPLQYPWGPQGASEPLREPPMWRLVLVQFNQLLLFRPLPSHSV